MLRGLQCRSVALIFLHILTLPVLHCECCPLILDKLSVTCCLSEDNCRECAVSLTLAACCRQSKDLDPVRASFPPGLHL